MNTEQKGQQQNLQQAWSAPQQAVTQQPGAAGGQPTECGQPPAYGTPVNNGQLPVYLQNILGNGQLSGFVQTEGHGYPPNVIVVTQPSPVTQQTGQRPQDYLTLSIISIFFFWPMAICALIYSCQSRTSAASGDYSRSLSEGRTARNLSIAAIIIAILVIIATVVPIVVLTSRPERHYDYMY